MRVPARAMPPRIALGRAGFVAARAAFVAVIVLSPFRGRLVLASRPHPPVYAEFTDFLLSAADIAMVATIVLWAAGGALLRRRPVLGPRFVVVPVAVLLGTAVLGIPLSADPAFSAYTVIRLVVLAAFAVYVVNEVVRLQQLILPISAMIVVQAVVGIGQVVAQRSLSLRGLGEHVLSPRLGVSVIATADGERILRAYALTDHPNILGGVLALGLLLIGGAFVAARLAAQRHDRPPAFAAPLTPTVIAVGAGAALLTFSRGSWIAVAVGLTVLVAMVGLGGDRRGLGHAGVVTLAVAIGVAPFIAPYHHVFEARSDRAIATEARSLDERAALNTAVSDLVADHPLLGVGVGALPVALRDAMPDFEYDYQPAAFVLLDATAETGVIGGIAFLTILVTPWLALARIRRYWTAELAGTSAALAALGIVGLVDYYIWSYGAGRTWAWLVLGLWVGAYQRCRPDAKAAPARPAELVGAHA